MTIRCVAALALAALLPGTGLSSTICPPQLRWQFTFGTPNTDEGRAILQSPDGGFIVGGDSWQTWNGAGNRTSPRFGGSDALLLRLDQHGQKLWDKSYGATSDDYLAALAPTPDGGLLLAGSSSSQPSIGSDDGNKRSPNYGSVDFWIVRLDAEGNVLWDKTFGGAGADYLTSVAPTSEGGFMLGGYSGSDPGGNKSSPLFGATDFWVVRVDAEGNKLWEGSFGGTREDSLESLQQTPDGGFILGGTSISDASEFPEDGNKTAPPHGWNDYWIVKIDASGSNVWDRAYGGVDSDRLEAVLVQPNGNLFLAGTSVSGVSSNKTVEGFGGWDYWVLALNSGGDILWQRAYGGEEEDFLFAAASAGSGGFILAGQSTSPPGGSKTSPRFRRWWTDCWLVRIDNAGNQLWDATYGGTSSDAAHDVISTAGGGYAFVASSFDGGGNKTSPYYGASDIWVVRLRPENAADCDNDGVPNAQDSCGDTPFGAIVNSGGCAIEQICPCDGWLEHSDYVACVRQTSEDFQNAGLITSAQRAEIIARAEAANCPPSFIAFGLQHVILKDTTVSGGEGGSDFYCRGNTNPVYGVTVRLGEADSGWFVDPWSEEIWGYGNSDWFLDGKVYGRFANGSNGLINTVRGTKPNIEVYPVDIDFTPLGASNLTFQYSYQGEVVASETNERPIGTFTVYTANSLYPRVNPFWRMPDGSIGTLIDLQSPASGGEDPSFAFDSVFVRANGARQVDYISHIEVIAGGDLPSFSVYDERLGVFRHRHQMIGDGLFGAANGQLTVVSREYPYLGMRIEFEPTQLFEVDFQPIELMTNGSSLDLSFSGEGYGKFSLTRQTDHLQFSVDFDDWSGETNIRPAGPFEVIAFRNGQLVGSCLGDFGRLTAEENQIPRIMGCRATASSNAPASLGFSTDRLSTFTCTNGAQLQGTHFQIASLNQTNIAHTSVAVVLTEPTPITITGERRQSANPRLAIALESDNVVLTWPDNTRLFRLESSPTLSEPFTPVAADVQFAAGRNIAILPRETTGSRFFRLAQPF